MPAKEIITLDTTQATAYSLVEEAGIFDEKLESRILSALLKLPPVFLASLKSSSDVMNRALTIRLISLVNPQKNDSVLVVGIEDGFAVALFESLNLRVFVLESNGIKAQKVRKSLDQYQFTKAITVVAPIEKGLAEYAPYDCILLNGIPKKIPFEIVSQLSNSHGKIVSLVGDEFTQQVTLYTKTDQEISRTKFEIVQGYQN